ncbi:UNVERIFIED_CONTAM: protein NRT1/ PTR FAMILY 1.2 [Sesamum angustifolium]|uniref:Protein NRT1/ PTR FAMILY 1.2 n=1 Tax=Sesamum angustifolium TaxID=2727405 RepID=A0AAW2LLE2_9LAMI
MEVRRNFPSHEDGNGVDQQEQAPRKAKGGLVTMPFIIANEAFEKVASYGLQPNMIFYLMNEYKMGVTGATNLIFYWSAATNFMPLVGAFLADSFLGRFLTIGFGSIASLLGMVQLWLTAMISRARPPPCDQFTQHCKLASPAQYSLLLSSFGLNRLVVAISLGFDSFNGCRLYSRSHGMESGVWSSCNLDVFSTLLFFIASSLYIKQDASKSLFAGFLQVLKQGLHHQESSRCISYRSICEPLEPVHYRASSFGMFTIITLTIWIVLYDRVIIPLASKIAGKKIHLGVRLRMGIGIFLSGLAMMVSGIVEHVRRKKAIEQGLAGNPHGVVNMSALWLVPQNCLTGLAEALNAIGQTEFYYSEFPKSMSSIASSLFGVGMAVGNLLASVVLSTVDSATKNGGKESWVSSNINKGHYDFYYWLLAAMTFINLIYFLCCSWIYGPCVERVGKSGVEGNGFEMEKLSVPGTPC